MSNVIKKNGIMGRIQSSAFCMLTQKLEETPKFAEKYVESIL